MYLRSRRGLGWRSRVRIPLQFRCAPTCLQTKSNRVQQLQPSPYGIKSPLILGMAMAWDNTPWYQSTSTHFLLTLRSVINAIFSPFWVIGAIRHCSAGNLPPTDTISLFSSRVYELTIGLVWESLALNAGREWRGNLFSGTSLLSNAWNKHDLRVTDHIRWQCSCTVSRCKWANWKTWEKGREIYSNYNTKGLRVSETFHIVFGWLHSSLLEWSWPQLVTLECLIWFKSLLWAVFP